MRPLPLRILALALALTGVALSGMLLAAHVSSAGSLVAGFCGESGSGCARVLESRWAVFPPAAPGTDVRHDGVPVAAIGLMYFVALVTWLSLVGVPGERRRELHRPLVHLVTVGCVASLGFLVVMARQLDAWCPYCVGLHAANLLLLVTLVVLRPRARWESSDPEHPRPRLVVGTLLTALFAGAFAWLAIERGALRAEIVEVKAFQSQLEVDASLIEARHLADTRFTKDDDARAEFDRVLRADDPRIPSDEGASFLLVVYSDVECPNCLEFDRLLSEQILPAFRGHLDVVYKHYPLVEQHEHAERAARAMEAARLQGRFWEMHAALLDRRLELAELDWGALALELGLDTGRFLTDLDSDPVRERVAEDQRLGRQIGVSGTPTVFLNRREVDRVSRNLVAFWRLRADALRRAREKRGQSW